MKRALFLTILLGSSALGADNPPGYNAPVQATIGPSAASSSASGQVNAGTAGDLAYYATTGAAVSDSLLSITSVAQNAVLSGPTSGSGAASFRALVAGDIPSLSGTYCVLSGCTLTGPIILPAGSALLPSAGIGSTTDGLYNVGSHVIGFTTNAANAMVIDAAQNLIVGSTAGASIGGSIGKFQILAAGGSNPAIGRWSADAVGANFYTYKSRGATIGSHGAVVANDVLGNWAFRGDDGAADQNSSRILGLATGTISSGVVPGLLELQTANSSGTLTNGLEIDSSQNIDVGAFVKIANVTGGLFATTLAASGAVTMPGLAASSASTTGSVCWTTGTGNLTVDTTTTCLLSAARFKQNVALLKNGLAEVLALRPVSYDLKPQYDPAHLGEQVGFIAEDVQAIDPRLVGLDPDGNVHGVRYLQMTALLAKAIQEQQNEIVLLQGPH